MGLSPSRVTDHASVSQEPKIPQASPPSTHAAEGTNNNNEITNESTEVRENTKKEIHGKRNRRNDVTDMSSVRVRERIQRLEESTEKVDKNLKELKYTDSVVLKNIRELKLKYEELRSHCDDIIRGVDVVRESLGEALVLWRQSVDVAGSKGSVNKHRKRIISTADGEWDRADIHLQGHPVKEQGMGISQENDGSKRTDSGSFGMHEEASGMNENTATDTSDDVVGEMQTT